ncbi:MAG: SMI1/KNR4 family protein [Candidatus Ancillula sp.]|jgi:hypothetical protein|nr:SMI1/KNR4 family protein [Candidatus Ancillula sp.]
MSEELNKDGCSNKSLEAIADDGRVGNEPWAKNSGVWSIYTGKDRGFDFSPYFLGAWFYPCNLKVRYTMVLAMTGNRDRDFRILNNLDPLFKHFNSNGYVWHHVWWYPYEDNEFIDNTRVGCWHTYPKYPNSVILDASDWQGKWWRMQEPIIGAAPRCLMQLVEVGAHNNVLGLNGVNRHAGACAQYDDIYYDLLENFSIWRELWLRNYPNPYYKRNRITNEGSALCQLNFPEPDSKGCGGGVYVPDNQTEETIEQLEESINQLNGEFNIEVPELLKKIYDKSITLEKCKFMGDAEGIILVAVFPCFSTVDDESGEKYMSIYELYTLQTQNEVLKKIIPKNYLPFATDGFGSYFYLDLDASETAKATIIFGDEMFPSDDDENSTGITFHNFKYEGKAIVDA